MSTELRSVLHSQDRTYPPGRLAEVKRGQTSDPGYPQPQAAEEELAEGQSRARAASQRRSLTPGGRHTIG
jgi:hypothetical protein